MINVEGIDYVVALCTMEMAAATERFETDTRPLNDPYANGKYSGYLHALEDLVAKLELIKKHVVTHAMEPDRSEAFKEQSDVVVLVRHDVDNFAYSNIVYVQKGVDLEVAIENAVREFLGTPEGQTYLENENGCFNYGDAIMVPEEIATRHGYMIGHTVSGDYYVNVDQNRSYVDGDHDC